MAALGRQVSGRCHLIRLPWARVARPTPRLAAQEAAPAALLRRLTTAPARGALGEAPCAVPERREQEPARRPSAPARGDPCEREDVVGSLVGMGFSPVQADALLAVQPGTSPQQLLGIVSELVLLGLNPEPVYAALRRSPQVLSLPVAQMRRRAGYLRKLGLGEGKLRRVLHCCPEMLTMPQRAVAATVRVLREKCLFTVQQVTEILHRCPHVLREDPGELEYKFQYAYFRMGVSHADVVRTDFLQYPITKTRQRHTFLERLGRYQTPDKKGQTQVLNPRLKDILRVSEAEFLARTACSSAEEFDVFKKLLAREEEEAENHGPGDDSSSEDEDGEDEDGEGQL